MNDKTSTVIGSPDASTGTGREGNLLIILKGEAILHIELLPPDHPEHQRAREEERGGKEKLDGNYVLTLQTIWFAGGGVRIFSTNAMIS